MGDVGRNETKSWRRPYKSSMHQERFGHRGVSQSFCGSGDQQMQNVVQLRRHGRPSFRERIADVEQLLAIDDPKPLVVKVSRTERILMELLLKRNMLTREVAWGV